jgi:hypothetical protein
MINMGSQLENVALSKKKHENEVDSSNKMELLAGVIFFHHEGKVS